MLHIEVIAQPLDHLAFKLRYVACDASLRDVESTDNVLPQEVSNLDIFHIGISLWFYPLCEVVSSSQIDLFLHKHD